MYGIGRDLELGEISPEEAESRRKAGLDQLLGEQALSREIDAINAKGSDKRP